jgi:predicted kinase
MEFEAEFRWIDVAEEVALLLADLRAHGYRPHAHAFLSGYLARSGDFEACRVLNLYTGHRALVRAKVAALEASGTGASDSAARARAEQVTMLDEAQRSLALSRPTLTLVAGLSGSGKTWLARRLAPELEAVHLSSDVERKRLAGLSEAEESGAGVAEGMYSRRHKRAVYEYLACCAGEVLAGGYSVLVDATFATRAERTLLAHTAARLSAPLRVIWCDAPQEMLRQRIRSRQRYESDASEADLAVLEWQLRHQEPIESGEGLEVIRVSAGGRDPLKTALSSFHPLRSLTS